MREACGDLDGDGYDDAVVGIPGEDLNGVPGRRAAGRRASQAPEGRGPWSARRRPAATLSRPGSAG
ncbi:hypothetical protein PV703_03260 [Streptomyces sp. ME01-24h]|nr:hypothetical protein [Streptomyces sp. ME19-03-3]MDX3352359.1 hypothetical protein [Streptomyces sp. ME01-24h]